ncbi:MAG TPA: 2-C-methyl-D-erythritol 2,4-cyclodiphosphate synthase [Burkholderiales bacterium]|nr:2-C-methyl-D-erythritol 2,4-cyclodiphosphate synthase [Burkholderiales bacterium]
MFRVGQGFDIHRMTLLRPLIIGGVRIPYPLGLLGHSDADVLLHSIIDALIGALALGDIGKLFPDTDSEYKNIDSRILLKKVYEKIKSTYEYKINNIDSTIIIEKPKLRDYIEKMRENIAKDLEINLDQINIKAKTNEGVGDVGKNKAVIAQAVVLLIKD